MSEARILQVIIKAKDDTAKGLQSAAKNIGDGSSGSGILGKIGGGLAVVGAAGAAAAGAIIAGANGMADAAASYGAEVVNVQRLTGLSAKAFQ